MQKIYVTYFLEHGRILPDETTEELTVPIKYFPIPDNCYGFKLWYVNEKEIDGEVLKGKPYGHATVYYGGQIYSLEEVKNGRYEHSTNILIENMEGNERSHIIHTRYGRCLPFDPDKDTYMPDKGEQPWGMLRKVHGFSKSRNLTKLSSDGTIPFGNCVRGMTV